jgi:2'-5' RNA ligase
MYESVAIVAIPNENDYVWKLSSEKVPHMTLLYLGDLSANPNIQHIIEFTAHVVKTSLKRFGMEVDRRDLLGPDDADVLYFNERYTEVLEEVRNALLQDPIIRAAYESVTQYPTFTPHLTMGYPESPAKADDREYPGISWVSFDKVSVWLDDSDGPTFRLDDEYYDGPLLHGEACLAHHGVKGMRWGVTKAERLSSEVTVKTNPQRPGNKIKTVGGKHREIAEDAKKAAVSKQIAKKSTTDALSNKELQDLVTRMNLEQQYTRLQNSDPNSNRGSKFINKLLGKDGDKNTRMNAQDAAMADAIKNAMDQKKQKATAA